MKSLEEAFDRLARLNTVPFGIGVDSDPCNKAWANSMGVKKTRLLADFWPHGEVAQQYGVFNEKQGVSQRANIIIDENGDVLFTKIYPDDELPDIGEILRFITGLSGSQKENQKPGRVL